MADQKVMSLRISTELAEQLEEVARADGLAQAEACRVALAEYVERKRADPGFRERLRARIAADVAIMERLAT
jgi:predicted transcriptional regulator